MKTFKIFLCAVATLMLTANALTSCKSSNSEETEEVEIVDSLGVCIKPDSPAKYICGEDSLIAEVLRVYFRNSPGSLIPAEVSGNIEIEFIVTKKGDIERIEHRIKNVRLEQMNNPKREWNDTNEEEFVADYVADNSYVDEDNFYIEYEEPIIEESSVEQWSPISEIKFQVLTYLVWHSEDFTPAKKDGEAVDSYYKIVITPADYKKYHDIYAPQEEFFYDAPESTLANAETRFGRETIAESAPEPVMSQEVIYEEPKPAKVYDFASIEQKPTFPGGDAALYRFISDNLRYPVIAQENGDQGRVQVSFVVSETGKISDVKIARGKTPELDKEAVRLVKSLPNFIPGKQNGHPVKCKYILPIVFKLM